MTTNRIVGLHLLGALFAAAFPNFTNAQQATPCHAAVQGRIAWDDHGNTTWAAANIDRLCHGATSDQPARCFDQVMHGQVDWGGGTQWAWANAIDLCAGSANAEATVNCFKQKLGGGQPWQAAIAACAERELGANVAGGLQPLPATSLGPSPTPAAGFQPLPARRFEPAPTPVSGFRPTHGGGIAPAPPVDAATAPGSGRAIGLPPTVTLIERAPIPHRKLEMADPATGRVFARDEMLTLRSGKRVRADAYFADLNKIEEDLNQRGLTLRDAVPHERAKADGYRGITIGYVPGYNVRPVRRIVQNQPVAEAASRPGLSYSTELNFRSGDRDKIALEETAGFRLGGDPTLLTAHSWLNKRVFVLNKEIPLFDYAETTTAPIGGPGFRNPTASLLGDGVSFVPAGGPAQARSYDVTRSQAITIPYQVGFITLSLTLKPSLTASGTTGPEDCEGCGVPNLSTVQQHSLTARLGATASVGVGIEGVVGVRGEVHADVKLIATTINTSTRVEVTPVDSLNLGQSYVIDSEANETLTALSGKFWVSACIEFLELEHCESIGIIDWDDPIDTGNEPEPNLWIKHERLDAGAAEGLVAVTSAQYRRRLHQVPDDTFEYGARHELSRWEEPGPEGNNLPRAELAVRVTSAGRFRDGSEEFDEVCLHFNVERPGGHSNRCMYQAVWFPPYAAIGNAGINHADSAFACLRATDALDSVQSAIFEVVESPHCPVVEGESLRRLVMQQVQLRVRHVIDGPRVRGDVVGTID